MINVHLQRLKLENAMLRQKLEAVDLNNVTNSLIEKLKRDNTILLQTINQVSWKVYIKILLFLAHCFLKMGHHGLFFVYFQSFSNRHQYNFTTNYCEKCPSRIQH